MSCKDRQLAAVAYYDFGELRTCTHAESFSDYRSILEPTCNFGLLYTVFKISSISYPYQCLFAPSAQKAWDGKKLHFIFVDRVGNRQWGRVSLWTLPFLSVNFEGHPIRSPHLTCTRSNLQTWGQTQPRDTKCWLILGHSQLTLLIHVTTCVNTNSSSSQVRLLRLPFSSRAHISPFNPPDLWLFSLNGHSYPYPTLRKKKV